MEAMSKRPATESEKRRACFVAMVDPDKVAEVWVNENQVYELVLCGFDHRINVHVDYIGKESGK